MRKSFWCCTITLTQLAVFVAGVSVCLVSLLFFMVFTGQEAGADSGGRLAIVIDDFGLQRKGVKEMLGLDCKLTVAVMPFLAYSEDDAENALEQGKEVILHIPMQATTHDRPSHLGPRPITINKTEAEIREWVQDALEELPEAVGANIHMGTLSSTRKEIMTPLMTALKENGLYFLDSKTSSKSVCRRVAQEVSIDFYENQVFLEHEQKTEAYVKKRLEKAMRIAKENGRCIAIGHVGNEGGLITVRAIESLLPVFKENNVELVFLSELAPMAR
ncbi:MAG: divergent polysaccharide deacetylase family protein [Clostridia bacterium]|nr:divergent polysaccharide deacetylase family protein [Clostridia bacterium]